ncbi:MAG: hypothetical protein EOO02_24495, partial [Chitinophagaceae bacterium]
MKTTEENIWNYLDGSATAQERLELEQLMITDPAVKSLFKELNEVSMLLKSTELDEPSMSFSRNVMEKVQQEIRPVALKTRVDQRIMYVVGGFFILSILAVLLAAVFGGSGAGADYELPQVSFNFDLDKYITPASRNIFLIVDAAIALIYLDGV